jgi:hypothetical protein
MLTRFYPELTTDVIDQFQNQMKSITENYSKELSAAQLQGFFMHNKESIKHVFDNIDQLYRL